ncbi:hypothetical protein ACFPFP_03960 [Bradyrhizobium sp. GCM10023182]|uniref:Uncharacterized protein n=1 Tax=Bradyrhizobium zhengyangense TaxID=2911009 RepID=A0ABS9LGF5_9BRAD|nr:MULTISPECIES: hypothetical protein [Bradyrhizobium]MCG2666080.1 hypothetical protein [Bradyrhizobium zhengyangense]
MRAKILAASAILIVCAPGTGAYAGKLPPPAEIAEMTGLLVQAGKASTRAMQNFWKLETSPVVRPIEHPYIYERIIPTPAPRLQDEWPSHLFDADRPPQMPNRLMPIENSGLSSPDDQTSNWKGTAGALGSGALTIGGTTCMGLGYCAGRR